MHAQQDRCTNLDERLDLAPLRDLLRTHTLRYLEGVTLDADNDGMGVWPLLGALVELLDDDDLLAGLAALEDDGDLRAHKISVSAYRHNSSLGATYFAGLVN